MRAAPPGRRRPPRRARGGAARAGPGGRGGSFRPEARLAGIGRARAVAPRRGGRRRRTTSLGRRPRRPHRAAERSAGRRGRDVRGVRPRDHRVAAGVGAAVRDRRGARPRPPARGAVPDAREPRRAPQPGDRGADGPARRGAAAGSARAGGRAPLPRVRRRRGPRRAQRALRHGVPGQRDDARHRTARLGDGRRHRGARPPPARAAAGEPGGALLPVRDRGAAVPPCVARRRGDGRDPALPDRDGAGARRADGRRPRRSGGHAPAPRAPQAQPRLRRAAGAGGLPLPRRARPGAVRRAGARPPGPPSLVLPVGAAAAGRRGSAGRARAGRVADHRVRGGGGARGAAAHPCATPSGEQQSRAARPLRLPSPPRRLGRLLDAADGARPADEPPPGSARGAGAAERRVGDARRRAAEAAREAEAARTRSALRGRRTAARPHRRAGAGRRRGAPDGGAPAAAGLPRRGRTRGLGREGAGRVRAAVGWDERPRMAGGPRRRRAGRADAGAGGRRRPARARAVPPPAAAGAGRRAAGTLSRVDGPRTETIDRAAWPARLDELLRHATHVHLLSPDGDLHARRTKKGRWLLSRGRPSSAVPPAPAHDRARQHPLADGHPLFRATRISRDKQRQVQHYVELLRPLPLWERDRIRVVDAGCGKAYMSLALVAYAREVETRVELLGVDVNPAVVETVRGIASRLGYDEASFAVSTIADVETETPVDLLVSLHACDTATDEAIAAGVRLGAEAIVVAPCCHHELADQLSSRAKDALLRHGLLRGRQADLVTDALRAAALEMCGFRVDVIEFVAAEHTAKNVMLRAVRAPSAARARRAAAEYVELRDRFGVAPTIERLLALPVTAGAASPF